jgi:hypothetical protein
MVCCRTAGVHRRRHEVKRCLLKMSFKRSPNVSLPRLRGGHRVLSGKMDRTLHVLRRSACSLAWTARSLVVNRRGRLILKRLFQVSFLLLALGLAGTTSVFVRNRLYSSIFVCISLESCGKGMGCCCSSSLQRSRFWADAAFVFCLCRWRCGMGWVLRVEVGGCVVFRWREVSGVRVVEDWFPLLFFHCSSIRLHVLC